MTLIAQLHYELAGAWMHSEMRGNHPTVIYMGHECTLVWPTHPLDFGLEIDTFHHKRATGGESGYVGRMDWIEVNIVLLQISGIDSGLTRADYEASRDPETLVPDQRTLAESWRVGLLASKVGDAFMRDYVQRMRVDLGQFWLGQTTFQPAQTWLSTFFDAAGERIPMGGMTQPVRQLVAGKPNVALTQATHQQILTQMTDELPIRLPESILQEARFTLWASPHADPSMATLLSAIAIESKVHQVLRRAASPERAALVEYVLSNPRDVTVSADNLFDKFCTLVCDRSLRLEDKKLFVALKALFQDRNKVAHRGARVDSYEIADGHVRTASSVFEWLASVDGVATTPLTPTSQQISSTIEALIQTEPDVGTG